MNNNSEDIVTLLNEVEHTREKQYQGTLVSTHEMVLVPWSWVRNHPNELTIGCIAYPDGEVIQPGCVISIT